MLNKIHMHKLQYSLNGANIQIKLTMPQQLLGLFAADKSSQISSDFYPFVKEQEHKISH